jgi:hypothetical protein
MRHCSLPDRCEGASGRRHLSAELITLAGRATLAA